MDFLMLRETECCGLLNHQGAFQSWSCVLGIFTQDFREGGKNGHGY